MGVAHQGTYFNLDKYLACSQVTHYDPHKGTTLPSAGRQLQLLLETNRLETCSRFPQKRFIITGY